VHRSSKRAMTSIEELGLWTKVALRDDLCILQHSSRKFYFTRTRAARAAGETTQFDHAVVEFRRGLNLLTGETGAGKSILIDALSLRWGRGFNRPSPPRIRQAAVSALFSTESAESARCLRGRIEASQASSFCGANPCQRQGRVF